jgi:hypothetical protein
MREQGACVGDPVSVLPFRRWLIGNRETVSAADNRRLLCAAGALAIPADGTTATGPARGTFTSFKKGHGVVTALGNFTGTVGGQTVSTPGSIPVTAVNGNPLSGVGAAAAAQQQAATCSVLDLTLGPLHLDQLGPVVDLNQMHLQITAAQGSGNLLGNLLCSVAGLLDNTPGGGIQSLLTQITNLLNQILGQL